MAAQANQRWISELLAETGELRMCSLNDHKVPPEMLCIEQKLKPIEIAALVDGTTQLESSEEGYVKTFTKMLHFEEVAESRFLIQFNAKNMRLRCVVDHQYCIPIESSTSTMADGVQESMLDSFTLKPVDSPHLSISGQVKHCTKDYIFVEIADRLHLDLLNNQRKKYDIIFHVNRQTYQLQHYALECLVKKKLFDSFLKHPVYDCILTNNYNEWIQLEQFTFSGQLAWGLNAEQKLAVKNIVQGENKPVPYLLFGPAGTGKTRTLVAAIEEIVRTTPNDNAVLVCANSNAACDEITERLVNVLPYGEMFRLYAKSYNARKISETIRPICNLDADGKFRIPAIRFLRNFRVIICTLPAAGCLARVEMDYPRRRQQQRYFNQRQNPFQFSHIIIDESASTHETETMIPIAGLSTTFNGVASSIILAGDPKQLPAVTKSTFATKMGFSTSLMERLFTKPLYQRHPQTGKYNHTFITQLVKNYRSHADILHTPNMLFYNNTLEVAASDDAVDWFIQSKLLPNENVPIILHNVEGRCKRSQADFSFHNRAEVDVVMDYIKKLLAPGNQYSKKPIKQSDIGVVAPYRLQCKFLSGACRQRDFNDITVGTAEIFQGQERPIMIISTVRTDMNLGFVNDARRMNVIITRAKCLLIIVGDVRTLMTNSNWKFLVEYCSHNNAIVNAK